MRKLALIATLAVGLLSAPMVCTGYYLDTPHNESNGMDCNACHGLPQFQVPDEDYIDPQSGLPAPGWLSRAAADPEDTLANGVCLECHAESSSNSIKGPTKMLHSSSTTGSATSWSTDCNQCHDQHFQGQLDWAAGVNSPVFLATGTMQTTFGRTLTYVDPNPLVYYDEYTTIGLNATTLVAKAGWEDVSTWKAKGGRMAASRGEDGSRGLILVPNLSAADQTYEIIDVLNVSGNLVIKVKGRMGADVAFGGQTYGVIYGQSIRSKVMPNGGSLAADYHDVKFFAPEIALGTYGGPIDETDGNPKPVGLCQICHTLTGAWSAEGGGADHYPDTDCSSCHNILNGGGAEPVVDTGGPYTIEQGQGLILGGGANFAPNSCVDSVSNSWDLDNNGTYDVTGPGIDGGRVNLTWAQLGTYGLQAVDVPHTIRLMVEDSCDGDQATASTTLTVNSVVSSNTAPVADAGPAQSIAVGSVVTLDGSASSDADSDPLTYSWTFTSRPGGSGAVLSGAGTVAPTFTADVQGDYVVSLVVNDGEDDSPADTVTISAITPNTLPVADAGPAQSIAVGSVVTLDGSASSDADSDPLTYSWTFTSRPGGSSAVLSGAGTVAPTFTADVQGDYVVRLVVNDGEDDSPADTVTITATNTAPVADAGPAQNLTSGSLVNLSALGSSDANNDPLTYSWMFTSRPGGSNAELAGANTVNPTFTADMEGVYVIRLLVNDGTVDSPGDSVSVTASTIHPVPDTGQTTSYTATFGEDHDYNLNPPSYTVHGDGTVTDNITGVIWQQEDDNVTRTWDDAIIYCENLELAGYTDWRLPEVEVLQTIVDLDQYNPAINPVVFTNTNASGFWTATVYTGVTANAWAVGFLGGNVAGAAKTGLRYVRCAR